MDDKFGEEIFRTTQRLHKGKVEAKKGKNITQMRKYVSGSTDFNFDDSHRTSKDYFDYTRPELKSHYTRNMSKSMPKSIIQPRPLSFDNDLQLLKYSYGDCCHRQCPIGSCSH